MHDELTQVDIDKMQAELEHRIHDLRPKLIEEVKVARSFGDLSENFEYKAAVVIERNDEADGVALFDKVTFQDEDGDEETIQLVTTLRQDALKGLISKESPVGKALMGRRVGDTVRIQVNENYAYDVTILSIEKTGEDPDIPISTF